MIADSPAHRISSIAAILADIKDKKTAVRRIQHSRKVDGMREQADILNDTRCRLKSDKHDLEDILKTKKEKAEHLRTELKRFSDEADYLGRKADKEESCLRHEMRILKSDQEHRKNEFEELDKKLCWIAQHNKKKREQLALKEKSLKSKDVLLYQRRQLLDSKAAQRQQLISKVREHDNIKTKADNYQDGKRQELAYANYELEASKVLLQDTCRDLDLAVEKLKEMEKKSEILSRENNSLKIEFSIRQEGY